MGDVVGGKYVLRRELGMGGMGRVWSAENSSTGAEVAVKALLPSLASSGDATLRFRDEAHATARLTHRGIVRIFDLIEPESGTGPLLIVMELLRGHTLGWRLRNGGPLSVEETLVVTLPILAALSHAHSVGVIHRDLKPDNVFLAREPDGQVFPKLIDFGISQLRDGCTASGCEGIVVGTPCYMAPEQARGDEVDERSDVFGVGVLLYECLSGTNPFRIDGESHAAFWRRPVRLEALRADLWAVIARALAERREDRFSSAAELAAALREATRDRIPRLSARSLRTLGFAAAAVVAAACAYHSSVASGGDSGTRGRRADARDVGDACGERVSLVRGSADVPAATRH